MSRQLVIVVIPILVGLVVTSACKEEETGLIISVSRDANSTPTEIEQLRFFIGVQSPDDVSHFIDDVQAGELVSLGAARDLASSPYSLLLRPRADGPMPMRVAVIGLVAGQTVGFAALDSAVQFQTGKILQWNVVLTGDGPGRLDVTDTDCLRWTTDDGKLVIAPANDQDCDNDTADVDCDDRNPKVGPSSPERCNNDINDDCDEETDEEEDADMDGVGNCSDCDDGNPYRFPGNPEICDGLDNDCNEICDDGELDVDEDKFTICGTKILSDGTCSDVSPDYVDCLDEDPNSHPGAEDLCDGVDNNCDGECDDGKDPDGDTYTECGSRTDVCQGVHTEDVDCEPDNPQVHPGADEVCDGQDNNCDMIFYPEQVPCYVESVPADPPACFLGSRVCDDQMGVGWVGECSVDAADAQSLDPLLCEAYDECEDMGAADPYDCVHQEAITITYDCTVYHRTTGEICEPALVLLPDAAVEEDPCNWSVTSGGVTANYVVGLRTPNGGPGSNDSIGSCRGAFEVVSSLVSPPVADSYLLHQTVDGEPQAPVRLDLTPVAVGDCPTFGLVCTDLPSAPPAD